MSDSVKPEEKPVALEQPKASEEITTTSEAAPAALTDEVTPVEVDKAADEASEEKKEKSEPKEITHGTLSKAHGGLLAFFKQKRFFYFQDEPIPEDKLKTYLHKDTASRSTAAYASQTGKGLLLYSKVEGQKEVPHGIIKLADVTDVIKSGNNKFILKLASNELHFESPVVERDSWVFTLNHKIAEAKASADEITNSEGYKAAFEKLSKPSAVPTRGQDKASETKEPETEDTEAKPEEADIASTSGAAEEEVASTITDKKAEVKRSPSKKDKRASVFAFFDKKKKAEEKKEDSTEKKHEEEESKDGAKPSEAEAAPVALTEDVPAETVEADEAEKSAEPTVAPKPTKRNSIFGAFTREKKEREVEEDKREEVKTESEIAEPSESVATEIKPIEVSTETPAAEKTPASSPPKPKFLSSFFDKKEKTPATKAPEKETEVKSLEATGPTTEIAEEATEAPMEATETTAVVVDDSAAVDSIGPATSPKEQKRKSSFFSFKKDKKAEEVKSDSEDVEAPQKSGATSPIPRPGLLTGLMRKASRSTKNAGKESDSKDVAAPETVAEETSVPITVETAETTSIPAESTVIPIGDAVPKAAMTGQATA